MRKKPAKKTCTRYATLTSLTPNQMQPNQIKVTTSCPDPKDPSKTNTSTMWIRRIALHEIQNAGDLKITVKTADVV